MALFEVIEKQGLKMIKASVDNDTVRAEAGALHYMIGDIELEVKAPSAKGFLKAMVTQETVFKPTYTGKGVIYFGPPTFGEYYMLNLQSEAWVLDKGAYVCSDSGVKIGAYVNKAISGLLGGEGLFQVTVEGTGTVVIQAPGRIEELDLQGEKLTVDGSFAVARQAHLDFTVRKAAKGLLSSVKK